MEELQYKSLYIDMTFGQAVFEDDFIVAVGQKKSNSVYHIAEVKRIVINKKNPKIRRFHIKVIKSDLMTALKRDRFQNLIPMRWYSRKSTKLSSKNP